MTTGCPGCNDLARKGQQSGKINYHHSNECRARIVELMKTDPEYRRFIEKHGLTLGLDGMETMTEKQIQEKVHQEVLTQQQLREKIHQVQRAIEEIKRRQVQTRANQRENELNGLMRKLMFEQRDVVEVYSPPRII